MRQHLKVARDVGVSSVSRIYSGPEVQGCRPVLGTLTLYRYNIWHNQHQALRHHIKLLQHMDKALKLRNVKLGNLSQLLSISMAHNNVVVDIFN